MYRSIMAVGLALVAGVVSTHARNLESFVEAGQLEGYSVFEVCEKYAILSGKKGKVHHQYIIGMPALEENVLKKKVFAQIIVDKGAQGFNVTVPYLSDKFTMYGSTQAFKLEDRLGNSVVYVWNSKGAGFAAGCALEHKAPPTSKA